MRRASWLTVSTAACLAAMASTPLLSLAFATETTPPGDPPATTELERQNLASLRRKGDETIQSDHTKGADAWREYLDAIEAVAAKHPDADLVQYAGSYLARIRSDASGQEKATLRRFAASPVPSRDSFRRCRLPPISRPGI